jgi:hypothetical protein
MDHTHGCMDDGKPEWSDDFAKLLLGSVVLVGITRRSFSGDTLEQFYGTVERADAEGINLALSGSRSGENCFLPPDPRAFFPAQPGSYRLRDTGEVVDNPDFTTTWTVAPDED